MSMRVASLAQKQGCKVSASAFRATTSFSTASIDLYGQPADPSLSLRDAEGNAPKPGATLAVLICVSLFD